MEVSSAVRPIYGSLGVKQLKGHKLVLHQNLNFTQNVWEYLWCHFQHGCDNHCRVKYMVCPKSNENDRGRWRGNPGIEFDLSQLSLHLCSSRYISKVRSSFCVLSRAKMQRSLEQRHVIKVCAKLGKSGSGTLHLLRTVYGDAVLSSGGTRRSRTEGRALRTNSAQGVLQLQELRTLWVV